jgi:hypothetical protein
MRKTYHRLVLNSHSSWLIPVHVQKLQLLGYHVQYLFELQLPTPDSPQVCVAGGTMITELYSNQSTHPYEESLNRGLIEP